MTDLVTCIVRDQRRGGGLSLRKIELPERTRESRPQEGDRRGHREGGLAGGRRRVRQAVYAP